MRGVLVAGVALLSCLVSAQSRIQDVIYMKQGGCAFTMDVFKPKTSNHKAVVYIVSGGWVSNHEGINPALAGAFTDKGYTVFEVVHGSQPKFTIFDIVPIVRRSIRFIRANAATYDISPSAIGVTGASAGGHLSLEIGGLGDDGNPDAKDPVDKVSSRADAVVAFMPPTDFENWGKTGNTPFTTPGMEVFFPAFGVNKDTPKETLAKVAHMTSPIFLINPKFPPTLFVHGDADKLVPLQQSQEMDAALETAHLVHSLVVIKGTGHDGLTVIQGFPATLAWFDKYLIVSKN